MKKVILDGTVAINAQWTTISHNGLTIYKAFFGYGQYIKKKSIKL
ncbi:MAG: hypothetical protein Ct9H300mP21_06090 [Pseudomonadota bacterium]|nr:MAG: hypothetical protein Ct9H300mP21_06090 [Pseudomonadota bacterium]